MRAWRLVSACGCTSTSKALPCRHASLARGLATSAEGATLRKSLDFAAPLFEPKKDKAGWFGPAPMESKNWMTRSRTGASIVDSQTKDRNSKPNEVVAPVVTSPSQQRERRASQMSLVNSYLALRSSTHSLLRMLPRSSIDSLLDATTHFDLPLVRQQLMHDLYNLTQDTAAWRKSKDEAAVAVVAHTEEIALDRQERSDKMDVINQKVSSPLTRNKVKRAGNVPIKERTEDYSNDNWTAVVVKEDRRIARSHLQTIVDAVAVHAIPASIVAVFPDLSDLERLDRLWTNFVASQPDTTIPLSSLTNADYRLSLSFLLQLIAPASSAVPSTLPLALKVFKHLVSSGTIPQAALASTPEDAGIEDVPREVIFNLVLLRTVIAAASDERFTDLAIQAMRSIIVLKADHFAPEVELADSIEFGHLRACFEDAMDDAHDLRRTSYNIIEIVNADDPLLLANSLLTELLPPFLEGISEQSTVSVIALLAEFSKEAALRERFDLLGPLWERFGDFNTSWIELSTRVDLLRYFSGDGSFRLYTVPESPRKRTPNTRAFNNFAASTFYALSKRTSLSASVSHTLGSALIEVLCMNRLGSGQNVDLAIRIYKLLMASATPANPFVLAPATLLALVRLCTPGNGGTNNVDFANRAIADFVSAITSPASPFAAVSQRILPQDITTLAQCYSLVGDETSTGQVFRRLLDQKMIPDIRDVLVILGSTARRDPASALRKLRIASDKGIVITFEYIKTILINTIAHCRTQYRSNKHDVTETLKLARSLGMSDEDVSALKSLARDLSVGSKDGEEWNIRTRDLWTGTKRSSTGETRPAVFHSLIVKAGKDREWRSVIELFRLGLADGIVEERSIDLTLNALLDNYSHHHSEQSRRAFMEVIDSALATRPVSPASSERVPKINIQRRKTFDTILRCCVKVGDLAAIDVVLQRMGAIGVEAVESRARSINSLRVQQAKCAGAEVVI